MTVQLTILKKMLQAVTSGDCEAVRGLSFEHPELLKHYTIGQTWLHHATQEAGDDLEMVKTLIEAGLDVNVPSENDDEGPLVNAISFQNIKVARYLLEHGADPNQGRTLIAAANNGSLELVKLLLEHGADLHKCYPNELADDVPMNALGQALSYRHEELAAYLREQGAVEPDATS